MGPFDLRQAWPRATGSALLVLLLAGAAAGKFTLEQILSAPFATEMTAARRGTRIAWVLIQGGARNVWIADAPDFAARQLTHYEDDDGQAILSLHLTPDGRTAVYARGSETNEQGEVADPTHATRQVHQQVWAADVDGGAPPRLLGEMECNEEDCEDIQISSDRQSAVWAARKKIWLAPLSGARPAAPAFYSRGDDSQPRWSPDGQHLAFVSARGDHSFIGIYDLGASHVRYIAPSVDRDGIPRWSPDGHQIAFIRVAGIEHGEPLIPVRPLPFAIWVADAAVGTAREIWHSRNDANGSLPDLTEDASFHFAAGGRIIFSSEQDGWNHLYSISSTGGEAQLLTPGNYETEDVTLSADQTFVIYTANVPTTPEDIDRRHIWRVSVTGGRPEPLTRGTGLEWQPAVTGDGRFIAFVGSSATQPAMPHVTTLDNTSQTAGRVLAGDAIPAAFPAQQLVTPRQVIFNSEDGLSIHGQLFMPPHSDGRHPALVFIHGGPERQMMLGFHYMKYYHNAYALNQYLASLGYVVLTVNFRSGIMYGRAFREAPGTDLKGASEYRDIVAAGRYLRTLAEVDPARVGVWGGSHGGYLTAMALARNSDIFAAGVDLHGVHDRSLRFTYASVLSRAADFDAAKKLALDSSPIAWLSTWRSPVLLIQGDDDRNVSFSEMVDLVQRLRDHHVPFEQIVYPDEIHAFLLWHTWLDAYRATAGFFDRVLVRGEKIAVQGQQLR